MSVLPAPPRAHIPLTPLIGREREVALGRALLMKPHVRLLTVTGTGGIGKTRLGLEIAAQLSAQFAGGVCFVPLAAVSGGAFVTAAIAAALRVQESGGAPLIDTVTAVLRDAETLMLVDNFEHVLDAAPVLLEILESCPRVRMIVTSRTLLRVAREQALPVPPLALPAVDSPLDRLAESPALRLFAERAQAVRPDFALTAATAPQAAEICRRLDGMPLAIELAAARVTHLSLTSLAERLQHRLPVLTTRARDRPDRHRTLRNAIAWSHDLLTVDQRGLFRRLAVFAGGFDLDAAEALVLRMDDGADADVALEGIASLVDASLLQHLDETGGSRYRMLETLREFAAEQLTEAAEDPAARRAHAAYFLEFAERHAWEPFIQRDIRELRRLDAEDANLRAALGWLAEDRGSSDFARLASVLGWLWFLRGHLRDGRFWLEHALSRGDPIPPSLQAQLRLRLGFIDMVQGEVDAAARAMTASLDIARADGDALGVVQALLGLGCLAIVQGRFDAGAASLKEGRDVAAAIADPVAAGLLINEALANLGVAMQGLGRLEEAAAYHQEALNRQRAAADAWGELHSLGDLGNVAHAQGDDARAADFARAALRLAQTVGEPRTTAETFEALAAFDFVAEPEKAVRLLGAAEHMRETTGITARSQLDAEPYRRQVAALREGLGAAGFAAAWAAGRALPIAEAIAEALEPARAPSVAAGPFTPRESEILRLLAAGLPDRAIAEELFLSVRTVENHVKHILAKLNVRTRTAAASAAIAAGFVAPPHLPSS